VGGVPWPSNAGVSGSPNCIADNVRMPFDKNRKKKL
jgi:hypothetical protein